MIQLFVYVLACFILQVPLSQQFQWMCNSNADCTTPDSYCTDEGLCECRENKVFNIDASQCILKAIGPSYTCTDDRQCTEWIKGHSECFDGNCQCKDGYRYLNGKCTPSVGLGDTCAQDTDCYASNDYSAMKCQDKKCVCADDYYHRDTYDCRPKAKVTGKCLFDIDCYPEAPYCDFGYGPTGTCTKDKPNNIQPIPQAKPFEEFRDFNIKCAIDTDCNSVQNSYCPKFTKKCACKNSFVYESMSGNCVSVLGSSCTDKCDMPNAICKNNICQCDYFYMTGNLNEKCYKSTRKLGDSCVYDINCQALGLYAKCADKMCTCDYQSKFNSSLMLCLPTEAFGPECLSDDDCVLKPHTKCDLSKYKCACKDGYRGQSDRCLSDIDSDCEKTEDCSIEHVECNKDNKCSCVKGFVKEDSTNCVKSIHNITEKCEADAQCIEIAGIGSICKSDTHHCNCNKNYTLKSNKCQLKKYIGDSCSSLTDCLAIINDTQTVCRDSVCSCEYGFVSKSNKLGCDSGAGTINNMMYTTITLIAAIVVKCNLYYLL